MSRRTPPRLAERILRFVLRTPHRDYILGDLEEQYRRRRASGRRADLWYWSQVLRAVPVIASRMARRPTREAGPRPRAGVPAGGAALRGGRRSGMGEWLRELSIAARSMARRPGYTLAVVAVLGLGIGVTTTIYSVVDGIVLRPLPYENASRLVAVGALEPGDEWLDQDLGLQRLAPVSFPNFLDLRSRSRAFEELTGLAPFEETMAIGRLEPEPVRMAGVTPGAFELLGVTTALGRTFLPEEYGELPEVTVLSHATWLRRFGGDPDIVGQALPTDDLPPLTVVGVLPEDFVPPEAFFPSDEHPELWMPVGEGPSEFTTVRRERLLYLVGRLSEGTSVDQARSDAARIATELAAEYPEANHQEAQPLGIGVNGLHAQTLGTTGRGLGLFLGAAVLLLILSALNAATLMLARALDRIGELSVRSALGAGRARIVRLVIGEAWIASVLGGAVGIVLAFLGVAGFVRYAPATLPRLDAVQVDVRVLGLAAAVSIVTGLAAGLAPALRVSRRGVLDGLRENRRNVAPSSGVRAVLVGGQMSLAVMLLTGAGLLFGSFVGMRTVDPGFDADGLIVMGVQYRQSDDPGLSTPWESWDALLRDIRSIPGVTSAALTSEVPLRRSDWEPRLFLPGDGPETMRRGIAGYVVTPGYLETMGTDLLRGRDFGAEDGPGDERVALVNESFVRTQLGSADPLGSVVSWSYREDFWGRRQLDRLSEMAGGADQIPIRIVGVVEDVAQVRVSDGSRPAIYLPYTQARAFSPRAVVRTSLPPAATVPALRAAAARYDSQVLELGLMEERLASELPAMRFQAAIVGGFALIALILAAAGLYGSMVQAVNQGRREMGVRIALGASGGGVVSMVVSRGLRLSLVGVAVGSVASLALARFLDAFLFGVEPNDPVTFLAAAAVICGVSTLACLGPARRATTVDPMSVLKAD